MLSKRKSMTKMTLHLMLQTLSFLIFSSTIWAANVQVGLLAGNIGLLGSVVESNSNSIGIGATAGYSASDDIALTFTYLGSQHGSVNHNEIGLGADFYLSSYDIVYPFLSAGLNFINNSFKDLRLSASGTGIFFGAGVEFKLGVNIRAGILGRYTKAFESTDFYQGVEIKTVQDSMNVLLKVAYQFGKADSGW